MFINRCNYPPEWKTLGRFFIRFFLPLGAKDVKMQFFLGKTLHMLFFFCTFAAAKVFE